uniref:Acetyltransf_13 domain-containing protein n=1 Tax=Elaeophora elaphi TaxID=1147741 RepID=A0A0R3S356_9BILA
MPVLRQKLLTDFYCPPEKCYESDAIPPKSIGSDCVDGPTHENKGYSEPLSPTENYSLSVSPAKASTLKVIRTVIVSGKENKKRRRMLADDPKQMILDAGQKLFGHQHCKQCSMVYDCDSLSDRKQHQEFHSRFQSTKWFRVQTAQLDVWKRTVFCIVEQFEGNYSHIFCIKQVSKCTLKTRVDKVMLECVNKELGYTPDLAQVWTSDGRRQAWVFITSSDTYYFIGAVVLVEKVSKEQLQYAEENNGNGDIISTTSNVYMGVNRIWVHQTLRRKGIAALLLDRARLHFVSSDSVPREMVAFSSLTDSGLAFAKNYIPGGKVLLYSLNPEACY